MGTSGAGKSVRAAPRGRGWRDARRDRRVLLRHHRVHRETRRSESRRAHRRQHHQTGTEARHPVKKLLYILLASLVPLAPATAQDPLPAWNDGAAKRAIVQFVARVTKPGTPDFVKPQERIATFDNDGTLWPEQPIYFQVAFAIDRVQLT